MMAIERLRGLAAETLARCELFVTRRGGLHAYQCQNEVQDFDRLSWHTSDGCEVQLNQIRHAEGRHYHNTDMTSVMLVGGYHWHLIQAGASHSLELFAAPGSIVRMGPLDAHWIPRVPSTLWPVSLCVFESLTQWHTHYPPLSDIDSGMLIGRCRGALQAFAKGGATC